ncbi:MAG: NADP-dependent 3-hydroxy acid dehydrogenase [Proteobacteria bacterium]|nr:MAG: NADP-dependent 3-hydroxy acid dehydrogenase [Pseudomonadota bacterium]
MIALVTGASAGFGDAISRIMVEAGYKVVGTARRLDRLEQLQQALGKDNFYPLAFDIQDQQAVQAALDSLPVAWRDIDVLINNAGLALGLEPAYATDLREWEQVIQTNIMGLLSMTRLILPGMVERNRGHIINMGSIAGTYPYPGGNVYGASKAFVKQFSRNLKSDLAGTALRVTNIEPGLCGGTEFSNVRFRGDNEKALAIYANVQPIQPVDIANTVLWVVQQPAHVNVTSVEIMPVAQSFGPLKITRKDE